MDNVETFWKYYYQNRLAIRFRTHGCISDASICKIMCRKTCSCLKLKFFLIILLKNIKVEL